MLERAQLPQIALLPVEDGDKVDAGFEAQRRADTERASAPPDGARNPPASTPRLLGYARREYSDSRCLDRDFAFQKAREHLPAILTARETSAVPAVVDA